MYSGLAPLVGTLNCCSFPAGAAEPGDPNAIITPTAKVAASTFLDRRDMVPPPKAPRPPRIGVPSPFSTFERQDRIATPLMMVDMLVLSRTRTGSLPLGSPFTLNRRRRDAYRWEPISRRCTDRTRATGRYMPE